MMTMFPYAYLAQKTDEFILRTTKPYEIIERYFKVAKLVQLAFNKLSPEKSFSASFYFDLMNFCTNCSFMLIFSNIFHHVVIDAKDFIWSIY